VKRLAATAALLVAAGCIGDLNPRIQLFGGSPSAIAPGQSTQLVFSVDFATSISIDQGVGDVTGMTSVTVTPTASTTYTLTASRSEWGHVVRSTATATVTVGHGAASRITVEGMPAQVVSETPVAVTITVRDSFGNPVTDYAGTVHVVNTDPAVPPMADIAFTPAMLGTAQISAVFFTQGDQSLIVSDTVNASLGGSAATNVKHASAFAYSLSPLPAGAIAGEPLPLTITVTDRHGNTVTDYAGTAHISSTDPTDLLPPDGGFTAGVRMVAVAFVTAGAHAATVTEVAGVLSATTSSVAVVSGDAVQILLSGASATAGAATSTTVTAKDTFANTVTSYTGTVAFTSSDGQAVLPASYTFGAADAGQHAFPVTLKTAGGQTVTATDAANSLTGIGAFSVAPGAATVCSVSGLPASAAAGAQLGLRVTVQDAFGNVATGYTGTMALSSSDPAAQLSAAATFTSTDAGSRVFSAQLRTAGSRSVVATDPVSSIACQGLVNVVPGAALFAVTFPAGPDAWAGTSVSATVAAQDGFGNPITTFAGTIAFTTSDAAATPNPLATVTLNGTEGGTTTVPITFNTVGTQSLTATQVGSPATTGAGLQTVHGLVYTGPPAGGKVRLVANATSNASFVQLDLISNATLVTSRSAAEESSIANCAATACSRRNGAFAAGMNLPLDVTKVSADLTLISTTPPVGSLAVLVLGPAPQAVGALINTATGVLYSGVSQKRAEVSGATTTLRGDANVSPFPGIAGSGGFYYSLRLRLIPGAAVGTVFDGANLPAKFRAAVRDRSGSDVFSNPDFAIGKLEVR
jgi:hypothetical protein